MSDLINLYAESDRIIIGDDSSPTLTLENTSTGAALRLQNAGGTGPLLSLLSCPTTALSLKGAALGVEVYTGKTGIQVGSTGGTALSVLSCPTTAIYVLGTGAGAYLRSAATEANCLVLDRSIIGSVTVGLLKLNNLSTPSAALFDFNSLDKSVISTASAGATLAYGVRVKVGDTYGWLPIYSTIA